MVLSSSHRLRPREESDEIRTLSLSFKGAGCNAKGTSVSNQRRRAEDGMLRRPADAGAEASGESRARQRIRTLWQAGDLFHNSTRYPRRSGPRVDRLAGILRSGIVAPAGCADGSVRSDLNIVVTGSSVPYDSLVFLHRFGPLSYLYTMCEPGRFAVFVDPVLPVLTPEDMGSNWVILCQDEVYVRDRVPVESLVGIAVHPADAGSLISEFSNDLRRLGLPLYDYEGHVLWPSA